MDENTSPHSPTPERGMGCVVKGCLTLLALGFVVTLVIGGLGWWGARSFAPFLDQHPAAIRIVPATDAQYQAVQDKLTSFGQAGAVSLSADDINVLIARDPLFADLRGRVYLAFEGGQLTADTSVPVNDLPENSPQQVFFSGHVGFDASYADNDFTVVLRWIKPLGGGAISGLAAWASNQPGMSRYVSDELNEHFHKELRQNPPQAAFFARVHTIIVEGGQIVFTVSPPPPAAVATPGNPP